MLEATPERQLVRECKRREWRCPKSEILAKGFPDRMVLAPFGRVAFVELKRHGTDLEPAQRIWRKRLQALGHIVVTLRTPEEVLSWCEEFGG